MTFDVIDYIGKFEDFIFVNLVLCFEDEYYDAIFSYNKNTFALSIMDELELKLNTKIEQWEGYDRLCMDIIYRTIDYTDGIHQLSDFNPGDYGVFKSEEKES